MCQEAVIREHVPKVFDPLLWLGILWSLGHNPTQHRGKSFIKELSVAHLSSVLTSLFLFLHYPYFAHVHCLCARLHVCGHMHVYAGA